MCPFSILAFLQPTTVDKEPLLNIFQEFYIESLFFIHAQDAEEGFLWDFY